jgi:hypothetical protein
MEITSISCCSTIFREARNKRYKIHILSIQLIHPRVSKPSNRVWSHVRPGHENNRAVVVDMKHPRFQQLPNMQKPLIYIKGSVINLAQATQPSSPKQPQQKKACSHSAGPSPTTGINPPTRDPPLGPPPPIGDPAPSHLQTACSPRPRPGRLHSHSPLRVVQLCQ